MGKENDSVEIVQPAPQPEPAPEQPTPGIVPPPLEIVTYSEPSLVTEVVVEIPFDIKTNLE